MQPGRARTTGLGEPLLLLARRVGWVAPVPPTLRMLFVAPCPSAAIGAFARAGSDASRRLFTGARAVCVLCAVSVATWRLFSSPRALSGTRVLLVASFGSPPLLIAFVFLLLDAIVLLGLLWFFFAFARLINSCFCFCLFFNRKNGKGAREHYRQRHGQLKQRCSSAVFLVAMSVAGVFSAVPLQVCGTRVMMYTFKG